MSAVMFLSVPLGVSLWWLWAVCLAAIGFVVVDALKNNRSARLTAAVLMAGAGASFVFVLWSCDWLWYWLCTL